VFTAGGGSLAGLYPCVSGMVEAGGTEIQRDRTAIDAEADRRCAMRVFCP
jgi:hypothetical protein